MPQSYRDQDNMDAVLSNIMRGKSASAPTPAADNIPVPTPRPVVSFSQASVSTQLKQYSQPINTYPIPEMPRRKKTGFKKRYVVLPLLLMALGSGGVYLRQPISTLLAQPSPFTQELIQNIGMPLYYPTKLPGTFKFELESIQASNGVVVYVISDDAGKTVSVSLQTQLEGFDIDRVIQSVKATKNSRKLSTPIGEAAVGSSEVDNRVIANVLTGKTWLLINMENGTLSDSDIDLLLNNFKQAK